VSVDGGGNRAQWTDLPIAVRAGVEERLGSRVVDSTSMPGGFSPGLASSLRTAAGDTVFVKAVGSSLNPDAPDFYRREARVAGSLPPEVPSPRLLWSFDKDDWVVLAFEHVTGRPPDVSSSDDLGAVLTTVSTLASALDPSPVELEPAAAAFASLFGQWQKMSVDGPVADLSAFGLVEQRTIDRLSEIEAGWPAAVEGTALVHGDLRPDNMILRSDGSVVVVDWPAASIGAAFIDLTLMLPSLALRGVDPVTVAAEHPLLTAAPADDIDSLAVALAGFFVAQSVLPAPPGLPTVREFQRLQAVANLDWLRRRRPDIFGTH
jgi:Phosphotransferase enzyme family